MCYNIVLQYSVYLVFGMSIQVRGYTLVGGNNSDPLFRTSDLMLT